MFFMNHKTKRSFCGYCLCDVGSYARLVFGVRGAFLRAAIFADVFRFQKNFAMGIHDGELCVCRRRADAIAP